MVIVAPDRDRAPDVSVVMVLWNCAPFLDNCLASIASDDVIMEVLCYDNASEDGSAAVAERWSADVQLSSENIGFPAAVNALIDRCRAPATLLLNPDVRLEPGAVSSCLRALEGPGVELVGANLRRPDGQPDPPAARRFRSVATVALESAGLTRLWRRLDLQYYPTWDRMTSRDVPCINGAFAMIRTSRLRELGGLDETVFLYLEDQELCRQVGMHGGRIRFVSEAIATHVGGGPTELSSSERRAIAYQHRLDASVEIVHRRQGSVARLAVIGILLLRCLTLLLVSGVQRDRAGVTKYGQGARWLLRQFAGRKPPPAVP